MPEFTQIQTYARCEQGTLPLMLEKSQSVIQQLGCWDAKVETFFSKTEWKDDGCGFVHSYWDGITLQVQGTELRAVPHFLLWMEQGTCAWFEFDLLFETEQIYNHDAQRYIHSADLFWEIIMVIAEHFGERGMFLTDEGQDGEPFRAIIGELKEKRWSFDLAFVPNSIINKFQEVPVGIHTYRREAGVGFVRSKVWQRL